MALGILRSIKPLAVCTPSTEARRACVQLEGAVAGANGFSPEQVLHYNQSPAAAPAAALPGLGPVRTGSLAARSVRASSLAAIHESPEEAPGGGAAHVRPTAPSS